MSVRGGRIRKRNQGYGFEVQDSSRLSPNPKSIHKFSQLESKHKKSYELKNFHNDVHTMTFIHIHTLDDTYT